MESKQKGLELNFKVESLDLGLDCFTHQTGSWHNFYFFFISKITLKLKKQTIH